MFVDEQFSNKTDNLCFILYWCNYINVWPARHTSLVSARAGQYGSS